MMRASLCLRSRRSCRERGIGALKASGAEKMEAPLESDLSLYDDAQRIMMEEQCILLDRDDKVIGSASKACHLLPQDGPVPLRRAFSCSCFPTTGGSCSETLCGQNHLPELLGEHVLQSPALRPTRRAGRR